MYQLHIKPLSSSYNLCLHNIFHGGTRYQIFIKNTVTSTVTQYTIYIT